MLLLKLFQINELQVIIESNKEALNDSLSRLDLTYIYLIVLLRWYLKPLNPKTQKYTSYCPYAINLKNKDNFYFLQVSKVKKIKLFAYLGIEAPSPPHFFGEKERKKNKPKMIPPSPYGYVSPF